MRDLSGQVIGSYELLRLLGQGGMGQVYHARHVRTGGERALKLLPEHFARDPHAKERLRNEALAASKLHHPHICTVHDVDEDDGILYVVMELYGGQTVAEALAQDGPFAVEDAVEIARQVADGLGEAHRSGIIHRDIKPSNIFLCNAREGRRPHPVILDFGVAKVEGVDLTEAGGTVGTIAYAAPEQLNGEVDARSDLWSLGVTLYEMLVGQRPFSQREYALRHAIQREKPKPLRDSRPDVPEAVEAVVMRLLEKKPIDRFQTGEEVRTSLVAALEGRKPKAAFPRSKRAAWTAGLLALALLAAVAWWVVSDWRRLPDKQGIAVLPFAVLGEEPGSPVAPAGLVEMIVGQLTQLERYRDALWVVPTSEVRSQGISSPGEAHKALGVGLAVEGSVDWDSTHVSLRLSLANAEARKNIDAMTLRVPRSDLDELQGLTLAALTRMLDLELRPEDQQALAARGTKDAGAFAAYVRGMGSLEGDEPETPDRAIAAFEHAVAEDPGFALGHAQLGEAYRRKYGSTHDAAWLRRAKAAAEEAISLNPDEPQGHITLSRVYTTLGRYDVAKREAHVALSLAPDSYAAYYALARAHEEHGEMGAAETAYLEAIALKRSNWRGHFSLARFYRDQKRYEEALDALNLVLTLAPDNAKAYNLLGAIYFDQGNIEEAREAWEHSVVLYPDYDVLSNLASIAWEDSSYGDAARAYQRALALDDRSYDVWGNLARTYSQMLGMQDSARAAYLEAIRRAEADRAVNPNNPELLADLATYYAAIDDTTHARATVEQAAAFNPEEGGIAKSIASAYEQIGARAEALRWVEKALAAGICAAEIETTPSFARLVLNPAYRALAARSAAC